MKWTAIKNGALLALASQHFDVFVTVDRNLSFQQNLNAVSIAVVVLQALWCYKPRQIGSPILDH